MDWRSREPRPTSFDEYHETDQILVEEGISASGQLLFNSGVIFYVNSQPVEQVFRLWMSLCKKYENVLKGDQEALTIAMEILDFNPYVLTKSYNLRGIYEPVLGKTRIWHARLSPPGELNHYSKAYPPRLLAKSRIRNLQRFETHDGFLRYLLIRKMLDPIFRLTRKSRRSAEEITG